MITLFRPERPRKLATATHGVFEAETGGPSTLLHPVSADSPRLACPQISIDLGNYQIRIAESSSERDAVCRLRFRVFNLELGEGLQSSYTTGLDKDRFDLFCDHLIVEDRSCGEIVGTYRMQSGATAAQTSGYYSEQEFDFAPYEKIRGEVLELGRACIDKDHRTSEVLTLLWRGIAQYAKFYGLRYLIGCSSLNSQDAQTGWSMYLQLSSFLTVEDFRTSPWSKYDLPASEHTSVCEVKIPRLLKTYIAVGARICGAPAWDREFGTIDFLTLLDLAQLSPAAKHRFLPDAPHSHA